MRMIQLRDRVGFGVEAVAGLRIAGERLGQNLDRDRAVEARVASFADFSRLAGAEGRKDFVRAEASAGPEGHDGIRIMPGRFQASSPAVRCRTSTRNRAADRWWQSAITWP